MAAENTTKSKILKLENQLKVLRKRKKKQDEEAQCILGGVLLAALENGEPETTKMFLKYAPEMIKNANKKDKPIMQKTLDDVLNKHFPKADEGRLDN